MQLIGMLDSPYVRRVAISFRLLGIPFEHHPLSVFSTFKEFRRINPVVKAPTLVCDDGEVLMDSNLILDYGEALAGSGRSLVPADLPERRRALRLTGLALAACEKTVQIIYERNLRPPEKQHQPWVDRVLGQLAAAYSELERGLGGRLPTVASGSVDQAGISAAVAWRFTRMTLPDMARASDYPSLGAFSERAERIPAFTDFPPD